MPTLPPMRRPGTMGGWCRDRAGRRAAPSQQQPDAAPHGGGPKARSHRHQLTVCGADKNADGQDQDCTASSAMTPSVETIAILADERDDQQDDTRHDHRLFLFSTRGHRRLRTTVRERGTDGSKAHP